MRKPDLFWHDAGVSRRRFAAVIAIIAAFWMVGAPAAVADPGVRPPGPPYRIVVIGDSITGGSNEGGNGPDGWPEIAWNSLRGQGIDVVPAVSGQGGSGYVQRGTAGTIYGEEAARLTAPDDSVILFFGSRNDGSAQIEEVSGAAHDAFINARRVAPAAKLVVVGPVWPAPDVFPPVAAIRDTLRQQAKETGAIWVDPIAEGWLTGPDLIGADGTHPNNAGHVEMAGRMESIIKSALGLSPR
jgi:lysophospholipase L1-like esterase